MSILANLLGVSARLKTQECRVQTMLKSMGFFKT